MIVRTQLQSLEASGWVTKAELKTLLSFQTNSHAKKKTILNLAQYSVRSVRFHLPGAAAATILIIFKKGKIPLDVLLLHAAVAWQAQAVLMQACPPCEREQLDRGPRELHVALDPRRAAASVCPACDLSLRHRVVPVVHTIKFEIFQVNSSIAPYPHPSYSNEVWAGRF